MQDIVRWFVTVAPHIALGLIALAVVRVTIPASYFGWRQPRFKAQNEAKLAALKAAKAEVVDDGMSQEERAAAMAPVLKGLAGMMGPLVMQFFEAITWIALTIWLFFAVWIVCAELPGVWGESVWWVGVLFEALKAGVGLVVIRSAAALKPWRKLAYTIWGVMAVVFLVVYALAPLGCLLYAFVVWLLTWTLHKAKRLRAPDEPPAVAMVFAGLM